MDPSALLPIVVVAGAFYLLIFRPSRARQSAAKATASRLAPGAKIMTTAGMFGRVVEIDGGEVVIEIAPGVHVRYVAAAIAKVIEDTTAAGISDDDEPSAIMYDTPEQTPR